MAIEQTSDQHSAGRGAAWLFEALVRHPRLAIPVIIALQHMLTIWNRDLWWSDEVRQGNVIQNVVSNGDWLVLSLNGALYPDKPPVYFWFAGALVSGLGSVSPAAIHFIIALTVLAYAYGTYFLAMCITSDRRIALVSVIVAVTCFYVLADANYARMDFLFGGCIAAAWGLLYRGAHQAKANGWIVAGLAACTLAAMIKGPFGLLLPLAAIIGYLAWKHRIRRLFSTDFAIGISIFVVVVLGWIAGTVSVIGESYFNLILNEQIAGRALKRAPGILANLQYFILLPALFLPWAVIAPFSEMVKSVRAVSVRSIFDGRNVQKDGAAYLWITIVAGLIVLTAVGEKHEYYLVPLFAPLAVLAARRLASLSPDQLAGIWFRIAAVLAIVGGLAVIASRLLPYPVSLSGILASSSILIATAVCLTVIRHRGLATGLLVLLGGQIIWINVLVLLVFPSLDAVMSPRPIANEMQPYIDRGYAAGALGMTPGTLAYHLDQPYFEPRTRAVFESWLAGQERAVIAMPAVEWQALVRPAHELREIARFGLAGDTIVVGRKPAGDSVDKPAP